MPAANSNILKEWYCTEWFYIYQETATLQSVEISVVTLNESKGWIETTGKKVFKTKLSDFIWKICFHFVFELVWQCLKH